MELREPPPHLPGSSNSGIMSGRESFGVGLPKSPVQSPPPAMENMRLAFSSEGIPVYKPVTTSAPQYPGTSPTGTGGGEGSTAAVMVQHGINMNMDEPVKRKRGRPRKYGTPDGTMALALTAVSPAA